VPVASKHMNNGETASYVAKGRDKSAVVALLVK
jgi:hypothetical protein